MEDPSLIKKSDEVVHSLKGAGPVSCFSVDVSDLLYSVPRASALEAVEQCIEAYGCVKFQHECGISARDFLGLLGMYLGSLYIEFVGTGFAQREGISIGSCIAPVLCDIYLACGDRKLEESLSSFGVVKCFRYVDDLLVCMAPGSTNESAVQNILGKFRSAHEGLEFTFELPANNNLQYLDLKLMIEQGHMCWCYHTRGEKQLLPFDSAPSKLVKRGIAKACLRQAIK